MCILYECYLGYNFLQCTELFQHSTIAYLRRTSDLEEISRNRDVRLLIMLATGFTRSASSIKVLCYLNASNFIKFCQSNIFKKLGDFFK